MTRLLSRRDRTRTLRAHTLRPLAPEPLEGRVVLSTITVTSLADSGAGSLRAAITQANGTADPETIEFAPTVTGQITLKSPLPDVFESVSVVGPGSARLSIARDTGNAMPSFRLLKVDIGAQVSISGLTLTGGNENSVGGGAIFNAGSLTITDSVFSGNQATVGGAILNWGTLTVASSTLSDNTAFLTGGAIQNDQGSMTVTNCLITGNKTVLGAGGGGISNAGNFTFTVPNIPLPAVVVVSNTIIRGNTAGDGGGLRNDSTASLTVINCTIEDNLAGTGGGIYAAGQTAVTGTTISNNKASYGGGINVNFGTLKLTNSTVSGNVSGGVGDGINIYRLGSANIIDSTLAGNSGNGINVIGSLTLQSTMFDNQTTSNLVAQPGGNVTSHGHNLFSDTPAITLEPTDLVNTDPLLAPLADYGGPTKTMALLPGSPAIDAGAAVGGIATDQRGVPRPQGSAPDIGAYESQGFTFTISSGDGQNTTADTTFAQPLVVTVRSSNGLPLAGAVIRFNVPTSGASATLSSNSATTDANGQATVTATANDEVGSYSVTTQTGDLAGPAFTLTNLMTPPPPPPPPPPVLPTPTVVAVQRLGVHWQPTAIVVRFSAAMDAGRAGNSANYRLISAGRDRKFGTKDDRTIRLSSVQYDPSAHSVRLSPSIRLPLRSTYQLTINGTRPDGLTGTDGIFLGGAGDSQPGTNSVTTIDRGSLLLPATSQMMKREVMRRRFQARHPIRSTVAKG